ncbi:hypothetical protein AGIG_G3865 [Arapaima gigas]
MPEPGARLSGPPLKAFPATESFSGAASKPTSRQVEPRGFSRLGTTVPLVHEPSGTTASRRGGGMRA